MKKLTLTCLAVSLGAITQAQTTFIQRIDMRHGDAPGYTAALLLPKGVEFWAFGYDRKETLDLEVGYTFFSQGGWSLAGYAVWWPDVRQTFVLPWVNYSSPALSGQLSLNLADYVPMGHGPHILFSDSSSWMWPTGQKGLSAGMAFAYSDDHPLAGVQVDFASGQSTYRVRGLLPGRETPSSLRFEYLLKF